MLVKMLIIPPGWFNESRRAYLDSVNHFVSAGGSLFANGVVVKIRSPATMILMARVIGPFPSRCAVARNVLNSVLCKKLRKLTQDVLFKPVLAFIEIFEGEALTPDQKEMIA